MMSDIKSIVDRLCSLHYMSHDGALTPLPDWALFFLRLGASISDLDRSTTVFSLAISVPTRTLVSSLVGAGLVISRAPLVSEFNDLLQTLRSLPSGTPISYRNRNRKFKGFFLGIRSFDLQDLHGERIGIQKEQGTTEWISISEAQYINVIDQESLRLPKRQKGRAISLPSAMLTSLVGKLLLDDFINQTQLDCLLIGPVNILEAEAVQVLLSYPTGDVLRLNQGEGTLGELLRIRRLLRSDGGYRSEVISTYATIIETEHTPYACVFDGALSYLKWRREWPTSHHIIVLDRTERNFEEAVREVNRLHDQHSSAISERIDFPERLSGVDMDYFERPL